MRDERDEAPGEESAPGEGVHPGESGPERQLSDADVDATFRELISQWRDAGDAIGPAAPGASTAGPVLDVGPGGMVRPAGADGDPRSWAPDDDIDPDALMEDEDDEFVPPEPEDLPSADDDLGFWAIIAFITGGILMVLYAVILDRGGSPWWPVTGLVLLASGFVLLVMRGGGSDDDHDMGIRV